MIWIWPGDAPPMAKLPSLQPPPGFKIHAEVILVAFGTIAHKITEAFHCYNGGFGKI